MSGRPVTSVILDSDAARNVGPGRAGGKGWHLGMLAYLGAPVPPAFVIDASVSVGHRSGDKLGTAIVNELTRELERRCWLDRPLAVRSSAPQEDSVRASFAGIHLSCLNVRGIEGVVQAVQRVLDSVWTPAAVAYRQRHGIDGDGASMAVVVMPLVPAVASGVAFTSNPLSGREDQVVIHANWGFGESVVGGEADPDEFLLEKVFIDDGLKLVAMRRGAKAQRTSAIDGGGTRLEPTSAESASLPVLSAEQAFELARICVDVATALDYTAPFYDIEWVWDGERFWVVQARPITARARHTYPAIADQPSYWSRTNARDWVPDPLSPMDWSLNGTVLNHVMTLTPRAGGYLTLPGVQRTALRFGRLYFEASIMQWEAFDAFDVPPRANSLLLGGRHPDIRVPKASPFQRMARAGRSVRFLISCLGPRRRAKASFERAHRLASDQVSRELSGSTAEVAERLRAQIRLIRSAEELYLLQVSGSVLYILLHLLEKHFPGEAPALAASLMGGGERSVTAEQSCDLMELARIAAEDTEALAWLESPARCGREWSQRLPAGSPFRAALSRFLDRFGHRAVYESYLRNSRWRETPDYLLDTVVNLIGCDPARLHERQQADLTETRTRIASKLPLRLQLVVAQLVRFATIERNLREGARSALTAHLGVVRHVALELGRRFVGPAAFTQADDVFNLTFPEALALSEGQLLAAVAANRSEWRRQKLQKWAAQSAPEVLTENGMAPVSAVPDDSNRSADGVWRGTIVGSGRAEGIACVARHPSDALSMPTGAILVAPSTDPSWTPLFLRAAAVIMESGGYLSHGAIVAREFGVPAVVNIPGILESIKDGDRLQVDASRGMVRRLEIQTAPGGGLPANPCQDHG